MRKTKFVILLLGFLPCMAEASATESTDFTVGETAECFWWKNFGDPLLDTLITRGIDANYDVDAAARRIAVARANLQGTRAAYFPTLTLGVSYGRTRQHEVTANSYGASVNMSWEVDVFGKIRAQAKESKARVRVSAAEAAGVLTSLEAEIATTYVSLLTARTQLEVARFHTRSQHHIMEMTESRFNAGLASKLDVAQAKTLYYSTVSTIPALDVSIETALNSLAVLLATDRSQLPQGLDSVSALPAYCGLLPEEIPADLVRRRPDILRAQADVDVAAATLGVARSEYLPSLTINGSVGALASHPGDMFTTSGFTYSIEPTLSWTIFDGLGRRAANIAATEELHATVDSYNLTVLTAMEEVRNCMVRYRSALRTIVDLATVVENARESLTLSVDLYRQGLTSFTNVEDAAMNYFTYQNQHVVASSQAIVDLIDLSKALGGGWECMDLYNDCKR